MDLQDVIKELLQLRSSTHDLAKELIPIRVDLAKILVAQETSLKVQEDQEKRLRLIETRVAYWCGAIAIVSILSGLVAHYLLHQ